MIGKGKKEQRGQSRKSEFSSHHHRKLETNNNSTFLPQGGMDGWLGVNDGKESLPGSDFKRGWKEKKTLFVL